jgi:hypothetical protein
MISRYEAYLNGIALSSISADILVHDIQYATPSYKNEVFSVAKRQGARIHRRYIGKAQTSIIFEIHTYNTATRQSICNAVQMWAKDGGILTTSDRPGQRFRCVCETPPVITSASKWTDELSVVFSAYSVPYWEDEYYASTTLSGSSGSGNLFVPGSVDDVPVEVDIVPSGTLTSISLTVNGRTLSISGVSIASGTTIKIAYDDEMIQSIMAGTTSILNKRTGVDDLLANGNKNNSIGFTSNVSCSVTFKGRGLWL